MNGWEDRWSREGLKDTELIRCRWCGTLIQATFAATMEHTEKSRLHHGELISACDDKRISSDGP